MNIKNVNVSCKKNFEFAEFLAQTSFSLIFETALKMAKETN